MGFVAGDDFGKATSELEGVADVGGEGVTEKAKNVKEGGFSGAIGSNYGAKLGNCCDFNIFEGAIVFKGERKDSHI